MVQPTYRCPSCKTSLGQRQHDPGASWICQACGGAAITVSVIRQHASPALANAIWSNARASRMESSRHCPACSRSLKTFEVEDPSGRTELDGCVACQFFWFDAAELARLGIMMKDVPSDDVRRAIATLRVEAIREDQKDRRFAETVRDVLIWSDWMW
jgi:Zn-finger nucleic acid-binding protein